MVPSRHVRYRTLSEDSVMPGFSAANAVLNCAKLSSSQASRAPPPSSYKRSPVTENAAYPKTSVFRSGDLTITISSPSVRVVRKLGDDDIRLPVFGDHDHVPGSVTLDPQNCAAETGRLTIAIEGAFEYISPMSATKAGPTQITPGRHRHVFYQDSVVIPLSAAPERPARPTLRNAMATLRRVASNERNRRPDLKRMRSIESDMSSGNRCDRSQSSSSSAASSSSCSSPGYQSGCSSATWSEASDSPYASPSSSPRTFNFDFKLPKAENMADELPPTFSSSNVVSAGVRGRVYAENADVKYKIRALWEALDGSSAQSQLETPILFQPDTDFLSLDGLKSEPWSEVPLENARGMPVDCAVTIPDPATFSRRASIPYFVVFTTKPRSRTLAAEIMADATIAVSLVRRVGFDKLSTNVPKSPQNFEKGYGNTGGLRLVASSADLRGSSGKRSVLGIRLDTSPAMFAMRSSRSLPESPSPSPFSSSPPPVPGQAGLFKRVVKSAPPIFSGFRFSRADPDQGEQSSPSASTWCSVQKPLPRIPQEEESAAALVSFTPFQGPLPPLPRVAAQPDCTPCSGSSPQPPAPVLGTPKKTGNVAAPAVAHTIHLTDARTLHTDVSVGFPKRPKGAAPSPGSHPSLESISALPDGLYKGCIPLKRDWFPSVKWKALSIEYFLQVSVIFDDFEFKGQVPLRLH
ncbi:hypothetical protein M0805_002103 [Coniferiporia weirii]|nr:hypothetical protein M0805_002103 [Coniferiporia weirii]